MSAPIQPVQDQDELAPGQYIAGYTIEKKIGEGAMAVLYLVTDKDGKQFSLKMPRQRLGVDPVSLVAFENELRLAPYLADFPHAYMPRVVEYDQQRLLLMEYIEGVDLWTHLRNHGCLNEDEAISLIKKIVFALLKLHERRILHLDIKLSNIMVTKDSEIRLIDFGLANCLDLPDIIHESFYEPKGTPCYIAPEQFIGVRDDFRSDIFSLGVMLFEMTTNHLPFGEGNTAFDVINRIKKDIVLPKKYNPNLSETFNYVVGTCLHANPEMRFTDMEHLYEMLGMWDGGIEIDTIMGFNKKPAEKKPKKSNPVTSLLKPAYRVVKNLFDFTPDNFQRLKQWAEYRRKTQAKKTYRILVAVMLDEKMQLTPLSQEIIEEAYHLAGLQNSAITIVTALENDTGMAGGEAEAQSNNTLCNKARIAISSLIQASSRTNIPVGLNIQTGSVVEVVENCINYYRADLLIIGKRKKGTFSHFMRNNNGSRILDSATCNTLIVKEGKGIMHRKASLAQKQQTASEQDVRKNMI
ncbi:MAG: bifunctional serine/threonine-protein kinase/universal stress protein [Gammaproteobacteria bacterium]|nr:bifunctional serine/threonine-protein kinase/universal stress protein [Gammaproteobacteria bacterium]MDH5651401.1 bifunctional serine/threonine-protein kinase/universal stress protein [Gammaproteobacteria bacterium]